jgi:hypothetical protein
VTSSLTHSGACEFAHAHRIVSYTRPQVYKEFGADSDPFDQRGRPLDECNAYLIQGTAWRSVYGTLRASYAWCWVFVLTCCFKLVAMGVLCHKAYKPFEKIVLKNKVGGSGGPVSLLQARVSNELSARKQVHLVITTHAG